MELNVEPDKRSDSGSGRGTGGPADRSVDAEPGSPQSLTFARQVTGCGRTIAALSVHRFYLADGAVSRPTQVVVVNLSPQVEKKVVCKMESPRAIQSPKQNKQSETEMPQCCIQ